MNNFKKILTMSTILIFIGGISSLKAANLKLTIGDSNYYSQYPSVAKIAIKYRGKRFEPIIPRAIKTKEESTIANISGDNDIIEYMTVYILCMDKKHEVTGIGDKLKIKINLLPKQLKELKLWFKADSSGKKTILQHQLIKKN